MSRRIAPLLTSQVVLKKEPDLQAKYVGRRTLSWLAWLLLANGSSNDLVVAYLVLVVDVDFPRLGYQLDGIHIPEGRSLSQFVLVSNQRHFVTICAISRRK